MLIRGNKDQNALFDNLQGLLGDRRHDFNCSVQGSGDNLLVMLYDTESGKTAWEWSGSPDVIATRFKEWVEEISSN